MITQDNRNNSSDDALEKKVQKLKQLLGIPEKHSSKASSPPTFCQKTPQSEKSGKNSYKEDAPAKKTEPSAQITVSGNNNIVSTKEIIVVQEGKKASFWKSIFFSALFF